MSAPTCVRRFLASWSRETRSRSQPSCWAPNSASAPASCLDSRGETRQPLDVGGRCVAGRGAPRQAGCRRLPPTVRRRARRPAWRAPRLRRRARRSATSSAWAAASSASRLTASGAASAGRGCSALPQTGQSAPSTRPWASSAAMPSRRACRRPSQCSRAPWATSVQVRRRSVAVTLRMTRASRSWAAASRLRAVSAAATAPASLLPRPGSGRGQPPARPAGPARSRARRRGVGSGCRARRRAARARRWPWQAGRPRPRPWTRLRRPPTSSRWPRANAWRDRGAGSGRPKTAPASVPVAGSACDSCMPAAAATARASSSSTCSLATSATRGSSGATTRAASTAAVAATCAGAASVSCFRRACSAARRAWASATTVALSTAAVAASWLAGREAFGSHGGLARGGGFIEQGGDPLRGVSDLDHTGDVQPGRLDDAGEHVLGALVDVVQRASALLTARDEPPLHVGESAGVEQALQQLATLLGVGAEELGELSLR